MLTPTDLGLPSKFSSFRPGQGDAVVDVACSDARFLLLSAPPGSGKSAIYVAAAQMLEARTLILVGTKQLQQQLLADFQSMGLTDIRGQVNYRCLALDDGGEFSGLGKPGSGCNDGPCHLGLACSLKQDGGCLYYDARARAKDAHLIVTNYAYWLTLGRHSDPNAIGEFDLLILDEAHGAAEWLASFCAVELDRNEVHRLLGLELPPIDEGVEVWAEWSRDAAELARRRYAATRELLSRPGSDRRRVAREMLDLSSLGRDLVELSKAGKWKRGEGSTREVKMPGVETDWVEEETSRGVRFSPVWAHAYAEPYLFRGAPRVILCSATLNPNDAKRIGIEDFEWLEAGRGFDPRRRPVYSLESAFPIRVGPKMSEGDKRQWISRMDGFVGARLDRKGIIHTRSYARARYIADHSRHNEIMITHARGNLATRRAVEEFKRASPPAVLVSPVVEEGYDFPGLECSYIVIAKLPFLDRRSPLVRARADSDKQYITDEAARAIVQHSGRGMRSADDLCEVLIADDHWDWFRGAGTFPRWFTRAWRRRRTLPDPLPLPMTQSGGMVSSLGATR